MPYDEPQPTVVVIDDDREVREALEGLLRSVGLRVELFASIQEFLDSARRDDERTSARLRADLDTLTSRERKVMIIVVAGRLNKQIAAELGLSEATVKVHRGQVMRKMRDRSLAELVRMTDKLPPSRAKS